MMRCGKDKNAPEICPLLTPAETAYPADVVPPVGTVAAGSEQRRLQEGLADGSSPDDRWPGDEEDA